MTTSRGAAMYSLIEQLYPICRSITGAGLRETLDIIGNEIALQRSAVPTGTKVLDWTVPKQWDIRDAWIKDRDGRRVVDFRSSNLHVVSYSTPVREHVSRAELDRHLFSLPDHPDWIPYRTSYYNETWGFCLSHRQRQAMTDDSYEVCIDSSLTDGVLEYAEHIVPGDSAEEVLISCHICHPSLCNDNLSGISLAVQLALHLAAMPQRRWSYRFLFIPGTIGSITWLARSREATGRIRNGLVLTCVGDPGGFTYKRSRRGDAEIDQAAEHVLAHLDAPSSIQDFFPYGYDERQFCSPGFNLPVGCIMRSSHGEFPQYHTSADDLSFVKPESLEESLKVCIDVFDVLEHNGIYVNQQPFGEPQLGRRGLYDVIGGDSQSAERQLAMLWVLNLCDGKHSLLDIATRAGIPFARVLGIARALTAKALLEEVRQDDVT
jgi:aminopeptidase-like protein